MSSSEEIGLLISQVAMGDRDAFRLLYDRTSSKLFGVCLRILKDREEAEDVLQEVYVKIWNKADRYATGKASGIAWLAAIARNQAIDRYRARKPGTANMEEAGDVEDSRPSPEASTVAADETRRINACLEELEPSQASVVKRTYLNGWSYQEAADELGVPLNTVKTWIRRSLLALRECMNR